MDGDNVAPPSAFMRTIAHVDWEIAQIKIKNPNWMTSETIKRMINGLMEEKKEMKEPPQDKTAGTLIPFY